MQSINPYKKEDLQLLKDNIQLFSNDVIDKLLYFINMEERKSEQEYQESLLKDNTKTSVLYKQNKDKIYFCYEETNEDLKQRFLVFSNNSPISFIQESIKKEPTKDIFITSNKDLSKFGFDSLGDNIYVPTINENIKGRNL